MAASVFFQSTAAVQLHPCSSNSVSLNQFGNSSFISEDFPDHCRLFIDGIFRLRKRRSPAICATSQAALDPISSSEQISMETALILVRHGESMWNEKNLFTGCVDVPLTKRGVKEAIDAGKRISNIPVDVIFTSALVRARMTAMLAMTQQPHNKVPVVLHNEDERAKSWSQIYSKETEKETIPVITAWQLNERMYGELQGFNKQATAEKYGKDQVLKWRRSYDVHPPNGENLEMCAQRAVAYFYEHIEPKLKLGKHVMVAAHANSLRAIIMCLDKLTSQEVINLELPTGIPMLYIYKDGKFLRRGSPVGPTEPCVYAYSQGLALYREKLDELTQ